MPQPVVRIEGLKELRKALKDSVDATPRELTNALKAGAAPVPPAIASKTPVRTGELRASIGKPQASGTRAKVPIKARHASFAEFQKKGKYGSTMSARYGPPPRFGYRGLQTVEDQVAEITFRELKEIVTAHGWLKD